MGGRSLQGVICVGQMFAAERPQRKGNRRLAPGGSEATGRRKASVLTEMLGLAERRFGSARFTGGTL